MLIKTGGPSSSFINTGTSFLRKIRYTGPEHKNSMASLQSVATVTLTFVSAKKNLAKVL